MGSIKTLVIFLIAITAVLILPYFHWHLTDDQPLSVAVIDPAAGNSGAPSVEEADGLTWSLKHYHHLDQPGDLKLYTSGESLNDRQLIVMNSAEETGTENQLEMVDVISVKEAVMLHGTDLVAQYGSITGSPDVKREMDAFLQLDRGGWTGKHFPDLNDINPDIPEAILNMYRETSGEWSYEGAGIILVHETDELVVVLSDEAGDLDGGVSFSPVDESAKVMGGRRSVLYDDWFDIIEANHEDQILATLTMDVTEQGKETLQAIGVDTTFPAIVHHQRADAQVYYLNGLFTQVNTVPALYQYTGTAKIREWLTFDAFFPETAMYWNHTVPFLKSVFDESLRERNTQGNKSPQNADIHIPARLDDAMFEVRQGDEWVPLTIKGVNIGMGKPGYFPGEAAITREEYMRWFELIGEMNANAIRNYTLHPPAFYEALLEYNTHAEEPLYLFHGVWIDEEPLEEELDAFAPGIPERFQEEIENIVDAIHGNAVISPEPGHASGIYGADVSDYVMAWIIGIEWYPVMVDEMLSLYPDITDVDLPYIYTEGADPFEIWLAEQLNHLTAYETRNYRVLRPLSFTNWVTTDHLDQPAEPLEQENMASVNPNTIKLKDDWQGAGMFASYHVYPYYPDFLNLEEAYTTFPDHRGKPNNYAGYIQDLHEASDYPVLIAEFGIPASRGLTHRNPFGWNQGFIEEQEQGDIVAMLYEDILHEGMLGGLIFAWQDEWFKRTWNTMDYDNPNRRPFWSNAQTNEQQFGLLSFDRHKIRLNGVDDWPDDSLNDLSVSSHPTVTSAGMNHDERYIYLQFHFDEPFEDNFSEDEPFTLYTSVREEAGITINNDFLADFRLAIASENAARLEVAGDYDTFYYDYDYGLKELDSQEDQDERLYSDFFPIRLALNQEMRRPDTEELIPFDYYEAGELLYGIGDPDHPDYHSLADYVFSEDQRYLEVRLPWMLLNARDPGTKEFMGSPYDGLGSEAAIFVDGLDFFLPQSGSGSAFEWTYTWNNWDLPEYEERLKRSYPIIQELFQDIQ